MNFKNIALTGLLLPGLIVTGASAQQSRAPKQPAAAQAGFVLSNIDTIRSAELHETRKINVYLPEGYSEATKDRYPVIYLLDGGVTEDFIHITGLVRYNTQPWINRFPQSIVVGIENTNRRRDFTFPVPNLDFTARIGVTPAQFPAYGGSGPFIAFIEKELQPFIAQKYRTNNSRTIIGESLGGLIATEILLKHRQLFDTYIIMSPSLWWGNESLLAAAPALLQQPTANATKVYIGACDKAENQIMYDDALALQQVLLQNGGPNIKVIYDYLPDETHATMIHQSVYNAFKLLYSLPGK